jgi:hypothetical protein
MKTSADEYSARPGNDDPLESWAPPLRDPLSRLRKFLLLVLVVAVPLALAAVGLALHGRVSDLIGAAGLGILVGGTPILAFIVYLLPGRPVDAFYLRSFHNDSRSWPMRKAAQVGLGPGFRLSGIRDFHRRRSFLDYLAFGTFILRYCTPKFMNLEAGADWKKRLWRSLGDARCALIDISEMTPSVREEIALAYGSLGPNRVQFIGDPFRTVEEWEQLILKVITGYAGDNHVLNVAMWDQGNSKQKRIFCKAVRAFRQRLPAARAGLSRSTFPLAATADQSENVPVHDRTFVWRYVAVAVIANVVAFALGNSIPLLGEVMGRGLSIAILAILGWYLLTYAIDCTSRQRVGLVIGIVLLSLWFGVTLGAIANAKRAGQTELSRLKLRQIGLAIQVYRSDYGRLPPAFVVEKNTGKRGVGVKLEISTLWFSPSRFNKGQTLHDNLRTRTACISLTARQPKAAGRGGLFSPSPPQYAPTAAFRKPGC